MGETIKRNQRILMRTRIKVAKLHSRSKHIKVKLFKILVKLKALRQREKRERRKAHRREIHLTRILRQEKVRFKRLLAKKRTAWTVVRNLHRRLRAVDARLAHKNEKIKIVQLHYQREVKETQMLHTREMHAISEIRKRHKKIYQRYILLVRKLAHLQRYEKLIKVKRASKLNKARRAMLGLTLQLSRLEARDKRHKAVIRRWRRKIKVARARYPRELRKLKFAIRSVKKKLEMVKVAVRRYTKQLAHEKKRQRRRSHDELEKEKRMRREERQEAAKEQRTGSKKTALEKKLWRETQRVQKTAEEIMKIRKLNRQKYSKALAKLQRVQAHDKKIEESLRHQLIFLQHKLFQKKRKLKYQEAEAREVHRALVERLRKWRAAKRQIIVKFKQWMMNENHKLAEEKLLAVKAKRLLRHKIAHLHTMKKREREARVSLRKLNIESALKLQHIRTVGARRLKREKAKGVALAKQLKLLQKLLAARNKQSRRENMDITHLEAIKLGLMRRTRKGKQRGIVEVEELKRLKVRESRHNILRRIHDAARMKSWRNRHDQMVKHHRNIIWQLRQRFARDHARLMGLIRKNKELVSARHRREVLEETTARRLQQGKDEAFEARKLHRWAEAEALKEKKALHAFSLEKAALVRERRRESIHFKHAMWRMKENASKQRHRLAVNLKSWKGTN